MSVSNKKTKFLFVLFAITLCIILFIVATQIVVPTYIKKKVAPILSVTSIDYSIVDKKIILEKVRLQKIKNCELLRKEFSIDKVEVFFTFFPLHINKLIIKKPHFRYSKDAITQKCMKSISSRLRVKRSSPKSLGNKPVFISLQNGVLFLNNDYRLTKLAIKAQCYIANKKCNMSIKAKDNLQGEIFSEGYIKKEQLKWKLKLNSKSKWKNMKLFNHLFKRKYKINRGRLSLKNKFISSLTKWHSTTRVSFSNLELFATQADVLSDLRISNIINGVNILKDKQNIINLKFTTNGDFNSKNLFIRKHLLAAKKIARKTLDLKVNMLKKGLFFWK